MKRRGYDCTRCTSLATFTGGFIHFLRFTSDKVGDYAPPRSRTFSAKNLTACKVKFRKVSLSTTWLEFIIHIWRTRLLLSFCAIFTVDDLTVGDVIDAGWIETRRDYRAWFFERSLFVPFPMRNGICKWRIRENTRDIIRWRKCY